MFLLLVLLGPPSSAWAQLKLGSQHRRVVVPDHLEFVVTESEFIVDTLIMDNRSTLIFEQPFTRVRVGYARIGKNCKWVGRGMSAGNYERRSMDGKSLDIEITFQKLGRLTIDVSGGLGHAGSPGRNGAPGANGQTLSDGSPGGTGGRGGDGGAGGNIIFKYRAQGDPVVFTKARKNSVVIRVDGGSGGPGGRGGAGGPGGIPTQRSYSANGKEVIENNGQRGLPGPQGNQGEAGNKGRPGQLKIVPLPVSPDGR
jgi:hypothetical protein